MQVYRHNQEQKKFCLLDFLSVRGVLALLCMKGTGVVSVKKLRGIIGDLKNNVESCRLELPVCVFKVRKIEVDFFIVFYVLSHSSFFRKKK